MNRETQTVLMFLLGLGTSVMVIKGTYLHYVKPALLPWLIATAVGLIGLALVTIVRDIRRGDPGSHDHQHRGWLVWLLLIPVAVTAFVIPPPMSARGATPEVAAAAPQKRPFPALPAERAPTLSLPEVMMRAAADSAGTLDNRLITVIGFTMKGTAGTDLGRVVIICCAADAQLARLHLSGPGAAAAAGYPDDSWLRVEGTVAPGSATVATSFVPTMAVATVTKIDKPANTYAY
jgi:uncharacterized repeat protein (TIGR03943 family)